MFNVGNRIREIRILNNMSGKELAAQLDVAQSFVSGLENNSKKCSMENLFKICEIFNITPKQFFDDSTEPITLSDDDKTALVILSELDPDIRKKAMDLIKVLDTSNKNYKIIKTELDNKPLTAIAEPGAEISDELKTALQEYKNQNKD